MDHPSVLTYCNSQPNLAMNEIKTLDELNVIITEHSGEKFFVSMSKTADHVLCEDAACDNTFIFADGSLYTFAETQLPVA